MEREQLQRTLKLYKEEGLTSISLNAPTQKLEWELEKVQYKESYPDVVTDFDELEKLANAKGLALHSTVDDRDVEVYMLDHKRSGKTFPCAYSTLTWDVDSMYHYSRQESLWHYIANYQPA